MFINKNLFFLCSARSLTDGTLGFLPAMLYMVQLYAHISQNSLELPYVDVLVTTNCYLKSFLPMS